MSKGLAFIIGISLMTLFGLLETAFPGRNAHTLGIIGALGTAMGAYISLQIVNNGVRGKYFEPELYRMENPPEAAPAAAKGEKK